MSPSHTRDKSLNPSPFGGFFHSYIMEINDFYSKVNSIRDCFGNLITFDRFSRDEEFDRKQIEELQRLRKEVERKRRQEEIESLKRELVGMTYY